MNKYEHLEPSVIPVLSWSIDERVRFSQEDRWIGYSRAHQVLDSLEDLLEYPRSLRMPNVLLVGDSGNGKSTIVEHFQRKHPVQQLPSGDPLAPLISIEMPSAPSESRFWTEILMALKIAHRESDKPQSKEKQALAVLEYVQARMLIIDEIHNVLHGTAREQRQFLAVLKRLSNTLKLPIVGVGTRDAILAMHTDTQLSSRFEAVGLPRWRLDKEFLRLLASFERLLPLAEPSGLCEKEMAIKIYNMSEGTIGGLTRLLKKATKQALRAGEEKISIATFDAISWTKLSDYRKQVGDD